jgi:hypothetical protein
MSEKIAGCLVAPVCSLFYRYDGISLTLLGRANVNMQKSCQAMLRAGFLGSIALALPGGLASGQTLVPSSRSIFQSPEDANKRHMAPTGKPCLSLYGYTQAQKINPNIFEHWVGVTNACGQTIKLKICYYKTQDCIPVDAPPWGRKEIVLGIYPALKDFRYDAKEQF